MRGIELGRPAEGDGMGGAGGNVQGGVMCKHTAVLESVVGFVRLLADAMYVPFGFTFERFITSDGDALEACLFTHTFHAGVSTDRDMYAVSCEGRLKVAAIFG